MQLEEALARQKEAIFDIHLFDIGGTPVTIGTLAVVTLVLALTFLVSVVVRRALRRLLQRQQVAHAGAVAGVVRLTHYLIMALGLAIALNTAGINLSALFAAGALFAIAIGFAMQELGSNLAAGLTLLIERTIKPGDVIQLEGGLVRVERMALRATIGRTLDDEHVIIPNAELVKNRVVNLTLEPQVRVRVAAGVPYEADMRRVRETLEGVAASADFRSPRREPVVLLTDFAESAVLWEVSVWTDEPWRQRQISSRLREAIWWALQEAGIAMPFRQVDVHLDPEVVESLVGPRQAAPAS